MLHQRQLPAWICRKKNSSSVVTYGEIYDAALTTAQQLRTQGVVAGSTIGITAPNGAKWSIAALAAWKIGANIAPIHRENSDHDIQLQIEAVKPDVMLVDKTAMKFSSAQAISMDISINISMDINAEAIAQEAAIDSTADPSEAAVRIYTSGSTGSPKIVRLSHLNLSSNVISASTIQAFNHEDRFISLLPFSHAMGLMANLLLPLYVGAAIVSPRVLAVNEILATLEEENISVVIAVPRFFRNIMQGLEKKFSQGGIGLKIYLGVLRALPLFLRCKLNAPIRKKFGAQMKCWVSGGSRLDGEICRYYHKLGLPLRQGYGLTETSPLTCIQQAFDSAVESVGKPIKDVEVKLANLDENGNGEVLIRGPNIMLGYENPEQNATAFEQDWFKSGDIGNIDSQGKVTLTGRLKRLIVTEAGKNVYPEELETLLERNPAINEAGVFELEMKPVCLLAIAPNHNQDDVREALRDFNSLVSAHNQITQFAITEALPRTPLGKTALQQLPLDFKKFQGEFPQG